MAVKKLILLFVFALTFGIVKAQCTFTANANVTINNPTSCNACNGSMIVNSITGGTSPYTYVWETQSGNFSNTSASGLCRDTLKYLTIYDANNCRADLAYDFNPYYSLNYNSTGDNLCGNIGNGSTTVDVTGGVSPYVVSLFGFSTVTTTYSATFNNLRNGSYYISVNDANNCSSGFVFSIEDISPAVLITITTNTSLNTQPCGVNCDGEVTALVSGGVSPYQYGWNSTSNYSSNNTLTGLCGGNNNLYVLDANSCLANKHFIIENVNTPISSFAFTKTDVSCNETSDAEFTISSVNGGIPPYMYSFNGSIFSTQNSFSGLTSGYNYVEIKDANNCQDPFRSYVSIDYDYCGTFNGHLYYDANNNCIFDTGESPFQNYYVHASIGNDFYTTNTDANGYYSIPIRNFGTYDVFVSEVQTGFLSTFCVESYTSSITSLTTNVTNDFLIQGLNACAVLATSNTSPVNPGFNCTSYIYLSNDGAVQSTGVITYTLPEGLTYVSANPSPSSINGNTLVWNYSNLSRLSNYYNRYVINATAATSLTIGSTLFATLSYDVNCTNIYTYSNPYLQPIFVTGPYDPNHKLVWPSQNGYEGDVLLTDNELTYKVEFQNIGTAPAVNVVVIDTLSPLLDENSIVQFASSHDCNFIYNSKSRQMQWRFNSINLPDSASNPTGSIGYFTYKVKQKPTNVVGDVVKNTAHIYFDFNSAIVTNTTKSTIVEPESVNEYKQNATKNTLFVYPNPSTGIFSLVFNANSLEKGKLIITDIAGKIVVQQDVESKNGNNVLQINSTDFSSGAYFVSIQFQEKELHQKVIIQK